MKTLFTIIFLFLALICVAQKNQITTASASGIIITDDVRLNQLGLDRKIDLSKGEQFTEKEWQEYSKQMLPYVKQYFQRDSLHRKFLENTIRPWLAPGDTLESWRMVDGEILLKLKPKKK